MQTPTITNTLALNLDIRHWTNSCPDLHDPADKALNPPHRVHWSLM